MYKIIIVLFLSLVLTGCDKKPNQDNGNTLTDQKNQITETQKPTNTPVPQSNVLDEKIRICKLYESQLRDGALSVKHIREYSVACGTEIGCGASERFEVIRIFR